MADRPRIARRIAATVMLALFLSMGTGLLSHLHELQHRWEDSSEAAAFTKATGKPAAPHPEHNDDNCRIHAQLHLPMLAAGASLAILCIGPSVDAVAPPQRLLFLTRVPARLDCRGPPAWLPSSASF